MTAITQGHDIETGPEEKGPERTCVVTRQKHGKEALIRFVLAPDGQVVPDIRAKLPGRGVWTLAEAGTVALAVKRKVFARAFKKAADPTDLPAKVDALLEADALQFLALVNKAGHVIAGTMKVESAIAAKPVVGLLHATEAGHDGIRKLGAALRRRFGADAGKIRSVQIFASPQLDLALGRTHVIHAALTAGAVSEGFLARSHRLERYRGLKPLLAVELVPSQSDVQHQTDEDRGRAVDEDNGLGPQDG